MGLLTQLFRHKSAPPDGGVTPMEAGGGEIRDLGEVAAVVGVRPERGMPGDFEVSVSDLLQRVPAKFILPGTHDANRILRIPAAEVAPGLVRGRAEVSLARLVALAPDVFRWERGESDDPMVGLPIQKLLRQIGSRPPVPVAVSERPAEQNLSEDRLPSGDSPIAGSEIVTSHLPSIVSGNPQGWEDAPPQLVSAAADALKNSGQESEPAREPDARFPETKPPEPALTARHPTLLPAAATPVLRTVELRPAKDASISSTLRAVVLGGNASGALQDAAASAGQILAPRTAAPVAKSSVVLGPTDAGPSVLPGTAGGGLAADFAGLQRLFMSSTPLDLAGVAALAAILPGVRACLICGAAGSAEAGAIPAGLNVEEIRAAAEEFARTSGNVESTTIHRGDSTIAIFTRCGVCLSAVADSAEFVPGVREHLLNVTVLLAGARSTDW